MGSRIRGVAVVAVVLGVGAFLGSALSQWWTAPLPGEGAAVPFLPVVEGERVRVEVLNGGDRNGMAAAVTDTLRARGFDVVYFGNASEPAESTVVLSRAGEEAWARSVGRSIGVEHVRRELDPERYVDVSVILGGEWEPSRVPRVSEPSERRWWDELRSWFRRPGAPGDARLTDPGQPG